MVVLEEAIVKVSVGFWSCLSLVEAGRDVAFINKVLGADLCNVHINHVGVVTIQLEKFVFVVQTLQIDVVLSINVLVGQDDTGLHNRVTRGSVIVGAHVFTNFALINSEVKVLLADNFLVSLTSELHFFLLVLPLN